MEKYRFESFEDEICRSQKVLERKSVAQQTRLFDRHCSFRKIRRW